MSVFQGSLRASLLAFSKEPNPFRTVYAENDGVTAAYNGSFFMLTLPGDQAPPQFADKRAILTCMSDMVSVWRIDYPYEEHVKKAALVAKPPPTSPVAKVMLQHRRNAPPWEILGVTRTADATCVLSAYRALSLRVHPDRCREEDASEAFRIVNEAYVVMSEN